MSKPPTYQVPKADHPWREYNNRTNKTSEDRSDIMSIYDFMVSIIDNWDKYKVESKGSMGYSRRIATLPQKEVALWLSSMLKKYYVDKR